VTWTTLKCDEVPFWEGSAVSVSQGAAGSAPFFLSKVSLATDAKTSEVHAQRDSIRE
jgi:hypothetical protein